MKVMCEVDTLHGDATSHRDIRSVYGEFGRDVELWYRCVRH